MYPNFAIWADWQPRVFLSSNKVPILKKNPQSTDSNPSEFYADGKIHGRIHGKINAQITNQIGQPVQMGGQTKGQIMGVDLEKPIKRKSIVSRIDIVVSTMLLIYAIVQENKYLSFESSFLKSHFNRWNSEIRSYNHASKFYLNHPQ